MSARALSGRISQKKPGLVESAVATMGRSSSASGDSFRNTLEEELGDQFHPVHDHESKTFCCRLQTASRRDGPAYLINIRIACATAHLSFKRSCFDTYLASALRICFRCNRQFAQAPPPIYALACGFGFHVVYHVACN